MSFALLAWLQQGQSSETDDPTGLAGNESVEIAFEHTWPWPSWVTLLLAMCVVAVVWLLYRLDKSASRKLAGALAALRISALLTILFMMFGWLQHQHKVDLPDLVIVLDDTASMNIEDQWFDERVTKQIRRFVGVGDYDQPTRFNQAKTLLFGGQVSLTDRLNEQYRVKLFRIGGSAREITRESESFNENGRELLAEGVASRLGDGLLTILDVQRGRPTAAIVLLTDGAVTAGQSLSLAGRIAQRRGIPVFAIGLGNDQPPRDVWLSEILVDDVVFVDDLVRVDTQIENQGYQGESVRIRLRSAEETLAEQTVVLREFGDPSEVRLSFRPQQVGTLDFKVEVSRLAGEADRENNVQTRTIDVRDATLRVLLADASPRYEYRMLRDLLSRAVKRGTSEPAFSLTTVLQEADPEYVAESDTAQVSFPVEREELYAYDVIILGDVNPAFLSRSVMEHLHDFVNERGGGLILSAGTRFNPWSYRETPLASLMPVDFGTLAPEPGRVDNTPYLARPTELGFESAPFQLADRSSDNRQIWDTFPPLYWIAETSGLKLGTRVLAEHPNKRNPAGDRLPVVCLQFLGAGKVIFLATDETYRWARFEGTELYYARFWFQMLRYLSRSKLSSLGDSVEVSSNQRQYQQGDLVQLRAAFLDERLVPEDGQDVLVILESVHGQRRRVLLQRETLDQTVYQATVGDLSPGDYRCWLAFPQLASSDAAEFTIEAPGSELAQLKMDRPALEELTEQSGGRFYTLANASQVSRHLPPGRSVRVESLPPVSVWNSVWLGLLVVAFLTTEWLLRKSRGMV